MPLSASGKTNNRQVPYGTKAAAGMSNTRTRTGVSAASKPEKNVTLHYGSCSSRQTVLISASLTRSAKECCKGKDAIAKAHRLCRQGREQIVQPRREKEQHHTVFQEGELSWRERQLGEEEILAWSRSYAA
jgi:hypothetical protein